MHAALDSSKAESTLWVKIEIIEIHKKEKKRTSKSDELVVPSGPAFLAKT